MGNNKTMKAKPFTEKTAKSKSAGADNPDKSDFEDSVNKHLGEMVKSLNDMKTHSDKGKVEKDEGADKYAKDYSDVKNYNDKQHKHEKLEKERKELVKEHIKESDVHGGVVVGPAKTSVEERLAALEKAVGTLSHFITSELRPDLSKGALKQEPKS